MLTLRCAVFEGCTANKILTLKEKIMSIFLKAVQRINPSHPDEPKKWYPVQYTTKMVDESEVAMLIAEETTLNPMEAAMAIRQLRKVMQRLLLDGKSVKLGDWGTFNVTLNTEGADTREALTAHNVKRVNINFQPGDELKTAMQKADFVWLDKLTESGTSDKPSEHEEEHESIL